MPQSRTLACLAAAAAILLAVPAQAARRPHSAVASHVTHHRPAHLRPATFHMRPHHRTMRVVSATAPHAHARQRVTRTAYHPGRQPIHVGS